MKLHKHVIIFLLLFTIHNVSQAQENLIEIEKINEFFIENTPWKTTPDSTMFIGFSFKIDVKKNAKGQTKSVSIEASDSLAYTIFPKYKLLKNIDYGQFIKDKKKGVIVIPVIIDLVGPQMDEYYTNENLLKYFTNTILEKSMSRSIKSIFFMNQQSTRSDMQNFIFLKPIMLGMRKRIMY